MSETAAIKSYLCCKELEDNTTYGYDIQDNSIHINSCCGECYALSDIKYCPYCGEKTPKTMLEEIKESKERETIIKELKVITDDFGTIDFHRGG